MRLFTSSLSSVSDSYKVTDPNVVNATKAISPLVTPTYDGSGQCTHDSVLYFQGGLWGYKYWMAMTPYPNTNDFYENPSILASNNGDDWVVPNGLTNPLDGPPALNYYADTELVYGYDNKMYCIWRHFDDVNYYLYAMTTSDGISWTQPVTIFTETRSPLGGGGSPSIIMENGEYTLYDMCLSVNSGQLNRRKSATIIGATWSAPETCSFINMGDGSQAWHHAVYKNLGQYHIILCTSAGAGGATPTLLRFGISDDGLEFTLADSPLWEYTTNVWDDQQYRSCGVFVDGSVPKYDMFYSGRKGRTWRIGRTDLYLK